MDQYAMNDEEFNQLVVEAIDSLPQPFIDMLDNVEVIVSPHAGPEHRRAVRIKPWQTLYGLYVGVPLTERTHNYGLVAPDTIFIFQAPLVRDFPGSERLRAQVRRTVLHELAHHFGISDERLHELGAY